MIVLENKSTYLLVFFDILCMLYHLSLSRYKVGQTQKLGEVVNNTISHDYCVGMCMRKIMKICCLQVVMSGTFLTRSVLLH